MKGLAVILVDQGVQDQEFFYPFYRLQEAGFAVEVAGPYGVAALSGKHGISMKPTVRFNEIDRLAGAVDIVVVPGGWECPEKLRQSQEVLDFLRVANASPSCTIGAICHGPWVLISAGVVRGRKMTCYKGMKDDLVNAGADYVDAPVVRDGNFVTSPHYRDCPIFMKTLLQMALCEEPFTTAT